MVNLAGYGLVPRCAACERVLPRLVNAPHRPIAVCLEQRRGALIYMLSKYAHLVLFPVHPTTAARYRETFCTSGAKDDPNDTASLLDLLLRHRERLRQLQPDTEETRLLQLLVEERRRVVNEKTRQSARDWRSLLT